MFTFQIIPDDGEPFEVTATARDIAFWEKTTKGASFGAMADGLRMVDLYKIAWGAARRQSLFAGDLAEFEKTCEIEFEEEAEPDPTRPAR